MCCEQWQLDMFAPGSSLSTHADPSFPETLPFCYTRAHTHMHTSHSHTCCFSHAFTTLLTHLTLTQKQEVVVVEEEEEEEEEVVEEALARPASPFAGLFGGKPAAKEEEKPAPPAAKPTPAPVSCGHVFGGAGGTCLIAMFCNRQQQNKSTTSCPSFGPGVSRVCPVCLSQPTQPLNPVPDLCP